MKMKKRMKVQSNLSENEFVQEMIQSTFDHVISHDKGEENLLSHLKIYVDVDFLDILRQLNNWSLYSIGRPQSSLQSDSGIRICKMYRKL